MMDDCYFIYAPIHGFLPMLALGWRTLFVVEPIPAHHGRYSMWLWRPIDA